MSKVHDTDTVAWYRQFWPWFLIALPGVVVIACMITIYIAVTNPDPLVDGNYYKQGLTINERLPDPAPTTQPPAPPATSQGEQH